MYRMLLALSESASEKVHRDLNTRRLKVLTKQERMVEQTLVYVVMDVRAREVAGGTYVEHAVEDKIALKYLCEIAVARLGI
jgi:hypothetical protein